MRTQHKKGTRQYICRICRNIHPLKKCRRFLDMNITKRKQVVKSYGYCANCLAHSHSQGSCFTRTGCKICNKNHHTLLHTHPRLNHRSRKTSPTRTKSNQCRSKLKPKDQEPNRSGSTSRSPTSSEQTSLSSILKQNAVTLLPTILAKISSKNGKVIVKCLLDSGSKSSFITSKIVDKLGLTTLALDDETICPLTLISIYDSDIRIETTLKMNNRVAIHTPSKSLPDSFKKKFQNIMLADSGFYKSGSIDIILGVDVYSKVIREGILSRDGLPTAQNTIFGWIIYGVCSI